MLEKLLGTKKVIKEINFNQFIWFIGRQNEILINFFFCCMDAVFKLLHVGCSKEGY